MNISVTEQSLRQSTSYTRPLVRIVIVGHVDHGKSTLIGRLLHETGSLPDGKIDTLKAVSSRRGMPFEWSFLLDALQTERDQGITLDTSQIRILSLLDHSRVGDGPVEVRVRIGRGLVALWYVEVGESAPEPAALHLGHVSDQTE